MSNFENLSTSIIKIFETFQGLVIDYSELGNEINCRKKVEDIIGIECQNDIFAILVMLSNLFKSNGIEVFITPKFTFTDKSQYSEIKSLSVINYGLPDSYFPLLESGLGDYLFFSPLAMSENILFISTYEPSIEKAIPFYDSSISFLNTIADAYSSGIYTMYNNSLVCINEKVNKLLHKHHNLNCKYWR